jgi:hypothetical protein
MPLLWHPGLQWSTRAPPKTLIPRNADDLYPWVLASFEAWQDGVMHVGETAALSDVVHFAHMRPVENHRPAGCIGSEISVNKIRASAGVCDTSGFKEGKYDPLEVAADAFRYNDSVHWTSPLR